MTKYLLAVLMLPLIGCSNLPPISGHHWNRTMVGAELYSDTTGEEAASFLGSMGDSAQVCSFEIHIECHYFETNEKALKWLAAQYTADTEKGSK